jgi:hypothetical protein
MGDYCLKVGWTDGTITEAQVRTLSTGAGWRATRGHLALLLDVGAVARGENGAYELAYFLDENPSVAAREAYAQEHRDQARSRKQRERSRGSVEPTSNEHKDDTKNAVETVVYDACHAEPTTTHLNDANAATHGILTHAEATEAAEQFEETLPWAKYLPTEPAARAAAEYESSEAPRRPKAPTGRLRAGASGMHKCIPAKFRNARESLNLGIVIDGLRKQGIRDNSGLAERVFGELQRAGVTPAQLRYADHCLAVRRRKIEIDDPIAYWMAIATYQHQADAAVMDENIAA